MDSNHRSHKTTDLQSVAFGRSAIFPSGLFGRSPTSFSVWKSCYSTFKYMTLICRIPSMHIGALSTTLLLSRDLVASSQCTLVPWAGIEPATQGFSVLCSTDWAIKALATRKRLELSTSSVTGWRSNQLSYRAKSALISIQHYNLIQTT